MTYHILTTQPKIYDSWLKTGLIARAIKKKIIKIKIHNLYNYGLGQHHSIDDTPYGGGAGMILRVDVLDKALNKLLTENQPDSPAGRQLTTILLTPQGKKFSQKITKKFAQLDNIILIAGRFEGYDERIRDLVKEEISIGDYVLTSGDLAAMVFIDAVSRHISGFIEKKESLQSESFENNLLEYPQYTRPREFKGKKVPEILLSGNHAQIANWRQKQAIDRTKKRRPDLTRS